MKLLLATGNKHKAEEIAAVLSSFDAVDLITLKDLPYPIDEPEEDGATLEANAYIKAHEIFEATGVPTLADDTGLEVDALDGAPGVFSARFAGPGATYADNCRKLLEELKGKDRVARFRTVICYVDGLRTLFAEGEIEGEIIEHEQGTGGFGYDPIFRPGGSDRTFAQMTAEEKNTISHRARALMAMRRTLEPYLAEMIGQGDG